MSRSAHVQYETAHRAGGYGLDWFDASASDLLEAELADDDCVGILWMSVTLCDDDGDVIDYAEWER